MASVLTLRLIREPTSTTLIVAGDIDYSTARQTHQQVLVTLRQGVNVHLDLGGVDFMDSAGFQMLVRSTHRARTMGAHLGVTAPAEPVHRLIRASGFELAAAERCICTTVME